ncbi:MAG: hypothetical protein RLZZ597_1217 [Cyanobacteriota bacterium]|jgi:pimeloyl-ACP methyl ester carboxylesterase
MVGYQLAQSPPCNGSIASVRAMKSSHDVVMRTGRLKVPSGTLFWHEAGRGETLVFLHGSWHDSGQWLPVMQALATKYHGLVPDLIGFGESISTATVHSVDLEVEALHTLLQALRIARCVLVGHSLGAWVALRYAQRYPDQVRGVAVVEPEGLVGAKGARWRLDRWLVNPLSPLVPVMTLASWFGGKGKLRALQRRRRTLRQAPAACQILFRRRPADIAAEQIDPNTLPIQTVVQFLANPASLSEESSRSSGMMLGLVQPVPAATTPLGLEETATATALRQLLATMLLTPAP